MAPPPGPWEQARRAGAHVFVDDLESPDLQEADAHHLGRVLRLRPGEAVSMSDGCGGWRPGRFRGPGSLEPCGPLWRSPRPDPVVTIGLALSKGDRPDWAVQKLTEAGVDTIALLYAARSVVRWEHDRAERRRRRFDGIARQAAMQSRRLWVPTITGPHDLASALADLGGSAALASPGGDPPSLDRPAVLVGPEGGWAPEEEQAAPATVALGPGVLRTETAAVVAGSLLVALRCGLIRPKG
ncbi:MAG: RsmE family RNA methyltransferase [Acidimicrobiales bacterium]